MVQAAKPPRRNEASTAPSGGQDELRDEIDALLEIVRNGMRRPGSRADRSEQLRAMVAHWAPALRELEKH